MNAIRVRRFLLRSFCAASLLFGAVPVAQAGINEDAKQLFSDTDELAAFAGEVDRLNPIDGGLSGEVEVFGVKASVFLYFPRPLSKPVIALLLPSISSTPLALGTIVPPLSNTPLDAKLDKPLIIVSGSEGYLDVARMPADVAARTKELGLASSFRVENGFNIFAGVANGNDALHKVLTLLNLQSPLVAGYSSPSKKVKVDGKKTEFKYRVLSLAVPPEHVWSDPFFLNGVSIQGAVLRMKTPKDVNANATTSFQVIGSASIGRTAGYHLFIERTFDKIDPTKSAATLLAINPDRPITIGDFLVMSRAMANALGLPENLPDAKNLPIDQIRLENPFGRKLAFPEEGAPPDFNTVMFAGASPGQTIPGRLLPGPLLTANAKAKVFGFEASDLQLNFDLTGIKATAGVRMPKLGSLELAKTSLDLAVRPQTVHMLLHADSPLGALTVAANSSGLSFTIPPKCPLKPVGLKARLDGFDLKRDWTIAPDMKDCLSAELKELIDDVGGKATETVGKLAGEVASTADELASVANDAAKKLDTQRVDAWGKAIVARVGPAEARQKAEAAVSGLNVAIESLNNTIGKLTNWIDDAMRSVWNAIGLTTKKKERAQKVAERDRLSAERVAVNQRIQQAADAERLAQKAVPSQDPNLRTVQQQQLGQMAIAAQQARIAVAARNLSSELATADARRTLLGGYDVSAHTAAAEAAWTKENGGSLDQYVKGKFKIQPVRPFEDGPRIRAANHESSRPPSGQAVLASIIDKKVSDATARILREEVGSLPTMAYGFNVLIQEAKSGLCMQRETRDDESVIALGKCNGGSEQIFSFTSGGLIRMPASNGIVRGASTGGYCVYAALNGPVSDNIDGIHIHPSDRVDQCLKPRGNKDRNPVVADNCAGKGFRYTPQRQLYSWDSTRCLDGQNSNINDEVYSYTCHNGENQRWMPHPDGTITNVKRYCLASSATGRLQLEACSGKNNQKWGIRRMGGDRDAVDVGIVNIGGLENNLAVLSGHPCDPALPGKPSALFFFDPIDGVIRHGNQCLGSSGKFQVATVGSCKPESSEFRRWKLIGETAFKSGGGVMKAAAKEKGTSRPDVTNLAPLKLE